MIVSVNFLTLSLDFTSYYAFRNRYAEMKTMHLRGRSIQVVDEFKNLNELSETLQGFSTEF